MPLIIQQWDKIADSPGFITIPLPGLRETANLDVGNLAAHGGILASDSTPILEAINAATDGAHAGTTLDCALAVELSAGWHVNSNKPLDEFLRPTEIKGLELPEGITVDRYYYPEGHLFSFAFSPNEKVSVFEEKFALGLRLRLAEDLAPGAYTIKGKLSYQACNDKTCLMPKTEGIEFAVNVVPASTPLKAQHEEVFRQIAFGDSGAPSPAIVDPVSAPQSDAVEVLKAMAGGMWGIR